MDGQQCFAIVTFRQCDDFLGKITRLIEVQLALIFIKHIAFVDWFARES